MRLTVLGGILLLSVAVVAQAKVYKWVDAQGRVHYSANPPPNTQASEVRIAPAPKPADGAAPTDDSAADAKADSAAGEQAAEDAARDEALAKNCEIARQNLKILENPAIRRFREEGKEPVYYTDEQRQAKIEESKKMVETFCKEDGKQ